MKKRPFWRGMRTRVLAVVVAAGVITIAIVTGAVVTLVEHDKEAWVSDQLLHEAVREQSAVQHRVSLARSELRVEALAVTAGDVAVLNRPSGPESPDAMIVFRGDEEVWAAGLDEASLVALRTADLPEPGAVRLLDHARLIIVEQTAGLRVVGLVVLNLHPPVGWTSRLVPGESAGTAVVAHTEADGTRISAISPIEPGLAVAIDAPLGPARAAAFALSRELVAWSILALLPLMLLAWILSRAVTSPLHRLSTAVRDTGEGRVSIPELPDDEIGDLGHAIHDLSDRLDRHIAGLRRTVRFSRLARIDDGPAAVLEELEVCLKETLPNWTVYRPRRVDAEGGPIKQLSEMGDTSRQLTIGRTVIIALAEGEHRYGALVCEDGPSERETRLAELLARTAVRRLVNAELSRAAAIDDKLRTLGQLSASVAHEMNTPLAFVKANLMALSEEMTDDDSVAMIADARVGVERLIRIVRDLSAAAVGGSVASSELADLGEVAGEMIRMARARRPQGEVSLRVDGPTSVSCDRGRVEQIILNLVNNALDASGAEGRVEVRVRGESGRVVLEVEDDGPGIDAHVQDKLFEAFFTTKQHEGTGLGLYISRSFAESHGGHLELSRTRPGSTVFAFDLPAASKVAPSDPPALVEAPALAHRPRVLVVDDDAAVVRAMERWLRRRAEVSGTTDPHEALAMVEAEPFDLVLSDMRMPGMGGVELAREVIASLGARAPRIVIVTGSGGEVPTDLPVVRKPLDARSLAQLLGPQLEAAE